MPMHIGHVALQVPDLARNVSHAQRTLALKISDESDAETFLTANEKRHELQLIASDRSGLDHVGLEVETESELDRLRDKIIAAGSPILSERAEEPGLGAALRCLGPGNVVFEIYHDMDRAPLGLDNVLLPVAQKLGHLTFYSDEKDELEHFILDVLNFRVSDRWGDLATWMRCDPDHHGLAVGEGTGPTRLHHYAFELESWAAMSHYADRIARDGQHFVWGPGRHGPGFNIFTYLPDPDGCIVEVYTDLLRIDNDTAYRAVDWTKEPRAMNLWGPLMPEGWDELGVPALAPATAEAGAA